MKLLFNKPLGTLRISTTVFLVIFIRLRPIVICLFLPMELNESKFLFQTYTVTHLEKSCRPWVGVTWLKVICIVLFLQSVSIVI